LNLTTHQH